MKLKDIIVNKMGQPQKDRILHEPTSMWNLKMLKQEENDGFPGAGGMDGRGRKWELLIKGIQHFDKKNRF